MPTYVALVKWTEQGRQKVSSIADRIQEVAKQGEQLGVKTVGHYVTMGRFDQIAVLDAPDDETMGRMLLMVAGRGNAETETLRAWTVDEVRSLV
jgi:uncharacterized protein with GYD domain